MKKKFPLVSIIIVNWNGGKVFEDCLKSLSKIDYPNWELIVVDNGSSDGSEKLASNPPAGRAGFHLIKNKTNLGFARANNQGYRRAKGKYILLLNNDTRVITTFLTRLVERMEQEISLAVIQPKIFMMDKPRYLDNAGSFLTRTGFLEHWGFGQKDSKEFEKEREVFSTKGACMLIRRQVIEEIGLFDADFISYFEESDFCWRVWLAGWKVLFYPKAKIDHKVGYTIKRLDVGNINYHYYKNRISSLIKNLGFKNLLFILPFHLFLSMGILFLFFIRGQVNNSLMIAKALVWNLSHLAQTLEKRKIIQKERKRTDKGLFEKLLVPVNFAKFYKDFKRVEADIKIKDF